MQIFKSMLSGFSRTFGTWKGILVLWFSTLVIVATGILPFRSFLKAGLNGSTITERLRDGLDIEVLGDLGKGFSNILQSIPLLILLLMFIMLILTTFINGGLFNAVRGSEKNGSLSEFFKVSAKNFWSFLVIAIIVRTILFLLGLLIVVLPVAIMTKVGEGSEKQPLLTLMLTGSAFLIIMPIMLMVADYARAWQVTREKFSAFGAISYGFSRSFGTFFTAYPMVLIISAVNILVIFISFRITGWWKPLSGSGVFLLFIVTQALFFIKIFTRVWRYGSITSLKEINENQ